MNASSPYRIRFLIHRGILLLAAMLCASFGSAFAQTAGSDYTKDLPSIQRVTTELKGRDRSDTLARQAALFHYLLYYIQTIKYNRTVRGPYTPAEASKRNEYSLAAYRIEQAYKKSHPPAEVKAWSRLEFRYVTTKAALWAHQLSGPQSKAAYQGAVSGLAQTYQRHEARMQQQTRRGQRVPLGSGGMLPNDAGSIAARRCLELGGNALQCFGKGVGTSVLALAGMAHSPLVRGPSYTGLTLTGTFRSRNGIYAVFANTTVGIGNCGKLLIGARAYTIQRFGSRIFIHVNNSPAPFTFVLASDGALQGPASAVFDGKVITGHRQVWVPAAPTPGYYQTHQQTTYQTLTPLEAQQYAGSSNLTRNGGTYSMSTTTTHSTYVPGSSGGGGYESVPIYAAKTQACSIGTLMPGPPKAVDQGMLSDLANAAERLYRRAENRTGHAGQQLLAPGIRLAGVYTSGGGLKAAFSDASVVLDCGRAHARDQYTVERAGSRILVHVHNPASPFTVRVQPDGSLAGPPTSVTIAGRLITSMSGNAITYAPHSETCRLGTLTPAQSASNSTTGVAR